MHSQSIATETYLLPIRVHSVEGVDAAEFNCVYAPAKQRGPIPGKAAARKLGVELNRVSTSSSAGEEYSLNRLDSFSIDDHPTDTGEGFNDFLESFDRVR